MCFFLFKGKCILEYKIKLYMATNNCMAEHTKALKEFFMIFFLNNIVGSLLLHYMDGPQVRC